MNAPKPAKSLAGQKCPLCDTGKFELVQIDHTEKVAEDNPVTIPGVWVDRCDHCAEVLFPGDTTAFIESVVSEQTEQLTPRELERIREDLGIQRQDEMSEILGLGGKTYHKWESGAQFPTRSMSCYIRVLAEFPEAFDWLRRRAWRDRNRLARLPGQADLAAMFPDLASPATLIKPRSAAPNERPLVMPQKQSVQPMIERRHRSGTMNRSKMPQKQLVQPLIEPRNAAPKERPSRERPNPARGLTRVVFPVK